MWTIESSMVHTKKKIDPKLSSVPTIIYAYVLHNYCERKIYLDEHLVQTQIEAAHNSERTKLSAPDTVYPYNIGDGEIIGNTLPNHKGICLANENIWYSISINPRGHSIVSWYRCSLNTNFLLA